MAAATSAPGQRRDDARPRVRLRFARGAALRGLAPQDWTRLVREAARDARLPVACGEKTGETLPRVAVGPSLDAGQTSRAEYADVFPIADARGWQPAASGFVAALNGTLPEGASAVWARRVPAGAPHLRASVAGIWYTVSCKMDPAPAEAFRKAASWPVERFKKGKRRVLDLKPGVPRLHVRPGALEMYCTVRAEGTPKPEEVCMAVWGLPESEVEQLHIERTALQFLPLPFPRRLSPETL
jgi:radical SAM-linked protein